VGPEAKVGHQQLLRSDGNDLEPVRAPLAAGDGQSGADDAHVSTDDGVATRVEDSPGHHAGGVLRCYGGGESKGQNQEKSDSI
jgi:hypothetical protein